MTKNTNPVNRTGKFHYGYVVVACCCLIMGINIGLSMSCAGIFYKPVSQTLGVSVGKFSLYMSVAYITSMAMLSVAGKLMEKFSSRWLLTANSAVLGVCLLSMSIFDNVIGFYCAGALMGVTLAFLLYLSFPTLINRWFKTRVGFMIGICSAASGIGGILFNPVGALIITNYGWRWAYCTFGVIILAIITPVLAVLLRDFPKDKGLEPLGAEKEETKLTTGEIPGVEYQKAIKMPAFYGLIIFAFIMMAVSTLNLFIPNFVTEQNYSLEQASFAVSMVMLGVTVGKIVLGLINDRNCRLGVGTTISFGIAGLVMLIAGKAGLAMIMGGAFLFGWEYAGVTVQTAMLVRTVFGNRSYSRIYAIISIALAAGGAVTSGGWGLLADATSYTTIFYTGIACLVIAGFIGIAVQRKHKF